MPSPRDSFPLDPPLRLPNPMGEGRGGSGEDAELEPALRVELPGGLPGPSERSEDPEELRDRPPAPRTGAGVPGLCEELLARLVGPDLADRDGDGLELRHKLKQECVSTGCLLYTSPSPRD
eukprot:13284187-Alexandrium_andersonii.AAC.1